MRLAFVAALLGACSSGGGGVFIPGALGDASVGEPSSSEKSGSPSKKRDGSAPATTSEDDPEEPSDGGLRDASKSDAAKGDASTKDASTSDSSSAPTESCQTIKSCSTGGSLEYCYLSSSSTGCTAAWYSITGGETYECSSCSNCTSASLDAQDACNGSGLPDSGSSTTTESCTTLSTTCKVGGSMQVCSTSSSTSGCLSTRYVHNGVSYPCTSCSSCDGAWGNAYVACMDAKYGCDDLEYCCGQFPAQSQSGCYSSVSSYRGQAGGDVQCKQAYESYANAGYCN